MLRLRALSTFPFVARLLLTNAESPRIANPGGVNLSESFGQYNPDKAASRLSCHEPGYFTAACMMAPSNAHPRPNSTSVTAHATHPNILTHAHLVLYFSTSHMPAMFKSPTTPIFTNKHKLPIESTTPQIHTVSVAKHPCQRGGGDRPVGNYIHLGAQPPASSRPCLHPPNTCPWFVS